MAIGKIVVTMGYPSGPDRLLALLDESEARGIQNRYSTTESLLGYLAQCDAALLARAAQLFAEGAVPASGPRAAFRSLVRGL